MTHEPECPESHNLVDTNVDCPCDELRSAYRRGREDAAKAMFAEWHTPHEFGVDVLALMYAAASGDGEQA